MPPGMMPPGMPPGMMPPGMANMSDEELLKYIQ
jgi:hypothetical protein